MWLMCLFRDTAGFARIRRPVALSQPVPRRLSIEPGEPRRDHSSEPYPGAFPKYSNSRARSWAKPKRVRCAPNHQTRRNKPQRPIDRLRYSDPRRYFDSPRPQPRVINTNRTSRLKHRRRVERPCDAEMPRQSPRPAHARHSADQHAARNAIALGNQIQTVVHAVDQIHIRAPRRPVNHLRPLRNSARSVRRAIVHTKVRFDLADHTFHIANLQSLSQQRTRHRNRVTAIERFRKQSRFAQWVD